MAPVNPYFSSGNGIGDPNEQALVESLAIEAIQITGHNFWYVPRTLVNPDKDLFHENPSSIFESYTVVEAYIESHQEANPYVGPIGLEVDETLSLSISRSIFTEETNLNRPMEGDLMYWLTGKRLYEIVYVSEYEPFFNLSFQYLWRVKLRLFDFSYETFQTTNPTLDATLGVNPGNTIAQDEFGNASQESDSNPAPVKQDTFGENTEIDSEADPDIVFDPQAPFGSD